MTNQHSEQERTEFAGKVSVIIPVLNESETIASVVRFARECPLVGEVIVVDDGSIDGTPEVATEAGAHVITSTMLGKGASMEDGLREARSDVLVYLDGDLQGLRHDVIERMTLPILREDADFVKARFTRAAGRVTILTARPLIRTYFPELAHFEQPLSGIMAARRQVLESFRFENDYGVDVGLFIDAALARCRIGEEDIGHLEHDSNPLEVLGEMATQVARTILDRAARCGRLRRSYIREVKEVERHRRADVSRVFQDLPAVEQLALFDMDGVLLDGRYIVELARRAGKEPDLAVFLDNHDMSARERMQRIGAIFTGVPKELFTQVAREIALMPGAIETVVALRKAGYRVGIVTDSYQVAAETVRRRVFADFSFSHLMRFRHGKASGKVTLCPAMIHPEGCREHDHCKVNVLRHLSERIGISLDSVIAIGDGANDVCLLHAVGQSVAFHPKVPRLREVARYVVSEGPLSGVLPLVLRFQGDADSRSETLVPI